MRIYNKCLKNSVEYYKTNNLWIKFTLHFLICFSFINAGICQDKKINKTIEFIKNKNFQSAEEIISSLSKKAPTTPAVLFVKAILYGDQDYIKFNIDSCFIYYSLAIEEVKKSDAKEQLELCSNFNLCMSISLAVRDSIAGIAFNQYKSFKSIEKMKNFNETYKGTKYILNSNNYIEELYYTIAIDSNTTSAYLDFLKLYR
jgi:hypothetical protein